MRIYARKINVSLRRSFKVYKVGMIFVIIGSWIHLYTQRSAWQRARGFKRWYRQRFLGWIRALKGLTATPNGKRDVALRDETWGCLVARARHFFSFRGVAFINK